MADTIHELTVTLRDIEPPVWRRLQVPSTFTLAYLHCVIQYAFDWDGDHLHAFSRPVGRKKKDELDESIRLTTFAAKTRLEYVYDFGDCWQHDIVVKAIRPAESEKDYPLLIAGEGASPPDDCGGAWGFADLVAAYRDTTSDYHEEARDFLGEDFDPAVFDSERIQDGLQALAPMRLDEEQSELVRLLGTKSLRAKDKKLLLARGDALVAPLLRLVANSRLALESAPGGGWPPIHAVELLADLGNTQAIAPLLEALTRSDSLEILYDVLLQSLPRFGAAVVEPALAALTQSQNDEHRRSLLSVLASCGVRDERIFTELCAGLDDDPIWCANHLALYGDVRAIPLITRQLDETEIDRSGELLANQDIIELAGATVALGGTLTPEQNQKRDAAGPRRRGAASHGEGVLIRKHHLGRNDPCWCNSGKKYKKCHLDVDEQAAYVMG